MNLSILVLIIMVVFFGGCRENSIKEKDEIKTIISAKDTFYSILTNFPGGEPQYFEDIQFLTGRHKLSTLKYPCIEIRNTDNKRIVTYHYDQTSQNTFIYQKVQNVWLAKFFSRGDTCDYWYTYQYVLPTEEISFTYSNKEATWFSDVTINNDNRQTIYVPEKGFTISPDLLNIPVIKNNYDYIHETLLIEKSDLIKIQTLRTTNAGVVKINYANCYSKISKRFSLNWWTLFGSMYEKADCE